MARPLRIEFADALYHVMSRGNNRAVIVRDDADRTRRLEWLARTVEMYRWRLHAFALMDNHEHLFVETPEANLSAGMQHLNGSYTSYFNRRHRRVGHLFAGRFKAQIIDNEGYFREISRYLHLNPVRARRVARPQDWAWSSYPGYHRASSQRSWVTYRRVLREFGRDADEARREYRRYVADGAASRPACPWDEAVGGLIVGGEAFVEKVRGRLSGRARDRSLPELEALRPRPGLERIVSAVTGDFGADVSAWVPGRRMDDAARAVAAYLARRCYGYRVRPIVEALGYGSSSGVVMAVRRIESDLPRFQRALRRLETKLASD